jgi:dTDP-4-amino-4,6-dideoxygalactose transaminase
VSPDHPPGSHAAADRHGHGQIERASAHWARGPVLARGTIGPRRTTLPTLGGEAACARHTHSGRAAIWLALHEAGVGPRQRVLLPSYHCPTMVEPVVRLGATPCFYPIDSAGSPDLQRLDQLAIGGARALLAAHFFGVPRSMAALRAWCDQRGIALIEDCAHAFFGMAGDVAVGTTGDWAIGSLPKFFAVVEGGCLVRRGDRQPAPLRAPPWQHELRVAWDELEVACDARRPLQLEPLARAIVALKRRWRRGSPTVLPAAPSSEADAHIAPTIDASRVDMQPARTVQWIVGHTDTERLVAARRRNHQRFAQHFASTPDLRPLHAVLPAGAVPYVFALHVQRPDALYLRLRAFGVPLFRWDVRWPGSDVHDDDTGNDWASRVLQLCCHQDLDEADIDAIAAIVLREHAATTLQARDAVQPRLQDNGASSSAPVSGATAASA